VIKYFSQCKHVHQKNWFSQYENIFNKAKVANFGSNATVPDLVGARPNKVIRKVILCWALIAPSFDVSSILGWCLQSHEILLNKGMKY
jgi:hypothetical protein